MSDVFEKNVADLVKRAALRPDAARAKERFLRSLEPRGSWRLAAAAAAALVAATIAWAAWPRPEPLACPKPPPEAIDVAGAGGNDLLQGVLKVDRDPRPGSTLRFIGKSPLPEGLEFKVRVVPLVESLVAGRLERMPTEPAAGHVPLRGGTFEYEFPFRRAGIVRLEVTAPDATQDVAVMILLKVPESERAWSFSYRVWSGRLLPQLSPQLLEAGALVAETRELLAACESACATEAGFAERKKALIADARRLSGRGESFAKEGLYPASARAAAGVALDLARSMEIFKWEGGKFDGPKDYYTDGKRGRDHRGSTFEFATLRGYLDEAERVAGREFGLWILEEFGRAGARAELTEAVKVHRAHPGVAPFAERLSSLDGVDLVKLNEELRTLAK